MNAARRIQPTRVLHKTGRSAALKEWVKLFALVAGLLLPILPAAGQGSPEGCWKFFNAGHSDGIFSWHSQHAPSSNLLRITSFKGGSGVLISVNEQGLATVSNEAYSWASQGSRQSQLSTFSLNHLRQIFHELASTTNSVPFWITNMASMKVALPTNQLVLVSFRDGTNWIQRQYSDAVLPKALIDCYDIVIPANMGTYPINRGSRASLSPARRGEARASSSAFFRFPRGAVWHPRLTTALLISS